MRDFPLNSAEECIHEEARGRAECWVGEVFSLAREEACISEVRRGLEVLLSALEKGYIRAVEPISLSEMSSPGRPLQGPECWRVNGWVKEAIVLNFRFSSSEFPPSPTPKIWKDKIALQELPEEHSGRVVPGSWVRRGAYLGPDTVIMPSFINIGAYVDTGTMIDSGVTVGSCVHVGAKSHISSNVVLGGVLEPAQNRPCIIEEGVFVGAGCVIAEGVYLGPRCVLAAGTIITQSTKIIHRATGEITYGSVPAGAVVVPGSYQSSDIPSLHMQCAIIVKDADLQTYDKTSLNLLLRTSN